MFICEAECGGRRKNEEGEEGGRREEGEKVRWWKGRENIREKGGGRITQAFSR